MLHLDNLKKQAKQIVRWHREGYYPVAQRIRAGLPRFRDVDDAAIFSTPFALSDAHEVIARELGFKSWQALRAANFGSLRSHERGPGKGLQLLGAHPQLFVSDVEASCRFFAAKLGFTVCFKYGKPPFMPSFKETALVSTCGTFMLLFSTETRTAICCPRAFPSRT